MKTYLLAACAALALGGTAYAFDNNGAEYACMHYGPTSSSCQMYREQQDQENRLRRLEQDQRSYQQRCSMFGRC